MTSVTTPNETGRGADIPGPRGGQGVRLLVLGVDDDARLLREQAAAAGFELAQRYSARVSHVAYGAGVDPEDGRYAKIRDAGLALLPIQACAAQLGLGEAASSSGPASSSAPALSESGAESPSSTSSPEDEPHEPWHGGLSDDEESEAPVGPDPLSYPPLPEEEPESASDAADPEGEPEPQYLSAADLLPAQGLDPDAVELAAAAVGADPWAGVAADVTGVHEFDFESVLITEDEPETAAVGPVGVAEVVTPGGDRGVGGDAGGDAPSPAARPRSLVLSFAWALVPFFSLGLLTPVAFGYAAVHTRSRGYALATLGYALAVLFAFALSARHPQPGATADGSDGLLTLALAVSWLGGTGHAVSARTRVFRH